MKKLVIPGPGTAGTIMLNKLSAVLDKNERLITIVDQMETNCYQPGFLFIPFGIYDRKDVIKPKRDFFPSGTGVIMAEIEKIVAEENKVVLKNNRVLNYDYLIIAADSQIKPEETEGLKADLWHKSVFHFYTVDRSLALANSFLNTGKAASLWLTSLKCRSNAR